MVGPDEKRLLCSIQPVAPLLQGDLYHQKLSVANIIILLVGCELLREEGAGVYYLLETFGIELPRCPPPINFRDKLKEKFTSAPVLTMPDPQLQSLECCFSSITPLKMDLRRGKSV